MRGYILLNVFFIASYSWLICLCTDSFDTSFESAEAKEGGIGKLPCVLTPVHPPDLASSVVWFKENSEKPFYKYDVRNKRPLQEDNVNNKYRLQLLDEERAELSVGSVKMSDDGVYRCRVEFGRSPTRTTYVNLTIIIPPESVQINDDIGPIKNDMTSSYAEGASMTLTCSAYGGTPLARIVWKRDGVAETNETQYFPDKRKSQSILKIDKLSRGHLLATYSCEVSNSVQPPPLVVRVVIDMYLRPLEVRLVGQNQPLRAGRRTDIVCRCKGSRPAAIITWWKDGVSLEGGVIEYSTDDNSSISTLSFIPTAADHGLILTCKASNQRIPHSELRDTWMLKVFYPPNVTLTPGHAVDVNEIKEGDGVYFECHLIANPWVLRVWWLRDGERLQSNTTNGIIVSNQTLVLQRVNRFSSGRYCCEASNSEGSARSKPFHLKVKFEPVCSDGPNKKLLGAAKDEPLRIECKVDAEPPPTSYRWSFNSTPGISKDLNQYASEPGGGVLTYVPRTLADYGTLQCWATNTLGSQRTPCIYQIVRAGPPEPPTNCAPVNVTHHSVIVSCKKGFDGGLKQRFVMQLNFSDNIIANQSGNTPEFPINSLEPSQEYTATVYAINIKGTSKGPTILQFKTLQAPGLKEPRRSVSPGIEEKATGPWLYIVLAAGSTLIVAAAIGAIIFAVKRFRVDSPIRERRNQRSPKRDEMPQNPTVSFTDNPTIADDKNPDLIPPSNETLLECAAPYTITARPSSKRNSATQMPVKPYHVTWAPILQSRNCATQTPPPHKESSV
nr:nephrin-like [Onthophagus taurus]